MSSSWGELGADVQRNTRKKNVMIKKNKSK